MFAVLKAGETAGGGDDGGRPRRSERLAAGGGVVTIFRRTDEVGKMERIDLEPDPVWTDRFEAERDRVRSVAGDGLLGLFHVGSTAVPDLAAKPVLDVLAVFGGEAGMRTTAAALVEAGYRLRRADPEWHHLAADAEPPVSLHLRPVRSDVWRDQLVVREYLRDHPSARRGYERVKREAVEAHADEPESYTDAKESFVLALEERAYDEGYGERIPDLRK